MTNAFMKSQEYLDNRWFAFRIEKGDKMNNYNDFSTWLDKTEDNFHLDDSDTDNVQIEINEPVLDQTLQKPKVVSTAEFGPQLKKKGFIIEGFKRRLKSGPKAKAVEILSPK